MFDEKKQLVKQIRGRYSIIEAITIIFGAAVLIFAFTVKSINFSIVLMGIAGAFAIAAVLISRKTNFANQIYSELEEINEYNWDEGVKIVFSPAYLYFADDNKYITNILSSYITAERKMTLFLRYVLKDEDMFVVEAIPENEDEIKSFEVKHSIWDKESLAELNTFLESFAVK